MCDAEPLSFLIGETASGKSDLALELAARAGAEIVSLDSMLVYRGMDVGTAKPSLEERARLPHHLIDRVDPPERYDVTRYLAESQEALRAIQGRGARALFVGGTAFYMKALIHGLFDGPGVDLELRARLQARLAEIGHEALHAELRAVDPRAAQRIHERDEKRVIRALEVWHQTSRPISSWQEQWQGGAGSGAARAARIVGLRRAPDALEARIAGRTRAMLEAGWVEEARAIRDGVGFGPTSIQALGYREVLEHADGRLERDELEALVNLRTRQFARRQRTWFRNFPEILWVDAEAAQCTELARLFAWA